MRTFDDKTLGVKTSRKVVFDRNDVPRISGVCHGEVCFPASQDRLIAPTNRYFRDAVNYRMLLDYVALYAKNGAQLQHQTRDDLIAAHEAGIQVLYAVTDWDHVLKDQTGRTVRSFLQRDAYGNPVRQGHSYDMYRQLSLVMQIKNADYARHVREWNVRHGLYA